MPPASTAIVFSLWRPIHAAAQSNPGYHWDTRPTHVTLVSWHFGAWMESSLVGSYGVVVYTTLRGSVGVSVGWSALEARQAEVDAALALSAAPDRWPQSYA